MAAVRDYTEHVAEGVKGEATDPGPPGKRPACLEMQGEIHRVEASIEQLEAPLPLVGGVERSDVMTDMVADDHAVPEILEKKFQRARFLHSLEALVAGD